MILTPQERIARRRARRGKPPDWLTGSIKGGGMLLFSASVVFCLSLAALPITHALALAIRAAWGVE